MRGLLVLLLVAAPVLAVAADTRMDPDAAFAFNGTQFSSDPDVTFPKGLALAWETLANPGGEKAFYVAEVRKGGASYLWLAEKTGETRQGVYQTLTVRDAVRLPDLPAGVSIAEGGCRAVGSKDDPDFRYFGAITLGETQEGDNWRRAEGVAWRADLVTQTFAPADAAKMECNHEQQSD